MKFTFAKPLVKAISQMMTLVEAFALSHRVVRFDIRYHITHNGFILMKLRTA
jgi:hypothetical protein